MTWNLPFGNEVVPTDADYLPTVPKKEGETWNDLLYRVSQLFSLHGQNKDALAKTKLGAWEYDIVAPFFKCNMTDIMASLGISQLRRYDRMMARRHEIIARYDAALPALSATALRHSGPDVVFMGSALDLPEQAAVAVLPDVVGEVGSDRLLAALRALPEGTRAVVVLKYFEDRSVEEIAAQLAVPVGTVKSRLFNARRMLCELLEKGVET